MPRITSSYRLALFDWPSVLNKLRIDAWFGQASVTFYLCAAVLVASLILGGGTRGGFLSDAILQFLAIPLLLLALWRILEIPLTKQQRIALWFAAAITLLPIIQLIPLPPWLWTALPNRQPVSEAFDLVGGLRPWMPISVSPQATWLSALSLIPPLAIFLATLLLKYQERRMLSAVILAIGLVSVFVGLIQVAQGPESPLRFFEVTNPMEAVGFFANRNHFAALLYCVLLLALAWSMHFASAIRGLNQHQELEYNLTAIVASIFGFTLVVVLLAGEAMARSRAGLGLTILGLFGAVALGFSNRGSGPGFTPNKLILGAVALAATFSLQFALYRIQERFSDPLQDARLAFLPTTSEAAMAYMPVGSGVGTFVPVYAMFEKPNDVGAVYINHAHNDVLEVWLETGAVGIVLMTLFLFLLIRRSLDIWRNPPPRGANALDWSLARAATILVALLAIHCFFDYPLRTGAMMAIMAFSCALLIEPPYSKRTEELKPQLVRAVRHVLTPLPSPALQRLEPPTQVASSTVPSRVPRQRWGVGTEWPKEWSKPASQGTGEDEMP